MLESANKHLCGMLFSGMARKRKGSKSSLPSAKAQKKAKTSSAKAKNQAVALLNAQQHTGASADIQQQAQAIVRGPVAQAEEPEDLVALHRVRFVPWQPTAAIATAATSDGSVLAVARDNGSIELWETATWTCFQVGLNSQCPSVSINTNGHCGTCNL